jgi:hypothetical protein
MFPRRQLLRLGLAIAVIWVPAMSAVTLSADVSTSYLWRGQVLDIGSVLQPSAELSLLGFTASAWANCPLQGLRFNELDLALAYSGEWRKLAIEPSLSGFLFFGADPVPTTAELGLRLAYPLGPLTLCTEHAISVLGAPEAYWGAAGGELELELPRDFALDARLMAGWASARYNAINFDVPGPALNDLELAVGCTWSPLDWLSIRPHLTGSTLLAPALRQASERPDALALGLELTTEL